MAAEDGYGLCLTIEIARIGIKERAEERGANESEITEVIRSGFAIPAKYGRIGKASLSLRKQGYKSCYRTQMTRMTLIPAFAGTSLFYYAATFMSLCIL